MKQQVSRPVAWYCPSLFFRWSLWYWVWVWPPSCGVVLWWNVVGYPYNGCAIITSVTMVCMAGWDCSTQGPQLSNTIGYFTFLVTCILSSSMWKSASRQDTSNSPPAWFFNVLPSSMFVSFNSGVLLSSAGGQLRALGIPFIVLGPLELSDQ